ncbi:MAG: thioredoxin domain-containing protein [Chloracidobacterium sp.]|nr:thioredoxin domain-containing protein [Chloracidobacterium sp.]MCO5334495.1 DsbA family protein [Pyrinomonadaceae bacterium]
MRTRTLLAILLLSCTAALAQKPDTVIAVAAGHTVKLSDLADDVQKIASEMPASLAKQRRELFSDFLFHRVMSLEAASKGVSEKEFVDSEKRKAADPSEAEIRTVYEANRDRLGDKTYEEAHWMLLNFLRTGPESKAVNAAYDSLKQKYKVTLVKDIDAKGIAPGDTVASISGKPLTLKEFDTYAAPRLYDLQAGAADEIIADAEGLLLDLLARDEAKIQQLEPMDLWAKEVTDKMKDFSDDEQDRLTEAFKQKLFVKYNATIVYKGPEPAAYPVSADHGPSTGPANAPVTVIMFSDFQCPACAATHPVLKKVLAEYPGKIRFVVRNFPLETLHQNAYRAALAAGAANLQGKFFEYTDILYRDQDKLDDASLKRYAAALGLNAAKFDIDLKSAAVAAKVKKDMADGYDLDITGTPTIYVNGIKVRRLTADAFRAAIDRVLKK